MSEAEKDALIGRLYRERTSLNEEIRLLHAKAGEIGQKLSWLGQSLRENALTTRFEGQSVDPTMVPMNSPAYSLNGASEADLRILTDTLREKTARLKIVERDLG